MSENNNKQKNPAHHLKKPNQWNIQIVITGENALVRGSYEGFQGVGAQNVDVSDCEIRKNDLTSEITKFTNDESALIAHIQNRLDTLAPRAANSSEDDAYRIREMRSNYLPGTIQKYLEIDTDQRDDINSGGMTNRETFVEQLHEMESALEIYASRLSDKNQSLIANGAFLASVLPSQEQISKKRAGLATRMEKSRRFPSNTIGKKRVAPDEIFMREGLEVAKCAYMVFLKSPSGQGYRGTTGTNEEHIIAVVPKSDGERPLCRFEKRKHKVIARAFTYPMVAAINIVWLVNFGDQAVGGSIDHILYTVLMVVTTCWLIGSEISNIVHKCTGLDNRKACDLAWRVATSQTGTKTGDPRTNEQAKIMALPVYKKAISEYDSMLTKDISSSVEQAQHLISSDLAAVVF